MTHKGPMITGLPYEGLSARNKRTVVLAGSSRIRTQVETDETVALRANTAASYRGRE